MLLFVEPVDLIYEHNAILHHHTHESHQADDGHKREGLTEEQQAWDNAADDEGETDEHEEHLLPVIEEQE